MPNFFVYILIVSSFLQDVPYRESSSYNLELGMEYKKISQDNTQTFKPGEPQAVMNTGYDFFLTLKLDLLELTDKDFKIKITNDLNDIVLSKKIKKPQLFEIDLGRSTEIKSGKSARNYQIDFIDEDKKKHSQIQIEFNERGDFFVNGELFGKI